MEMPFVVVVYDEFEPESYRAIRVLLTDGTQRDYATGDAVADMQSALTELGDACYAFSSSVDQFQMDGGVLFEATVEVGDDELADATLTLEIVRVLERAAILRPMDEGERLQLAGNILGSVYKARYPLALAA